MFSGLQREDTVGSEDMSGWCVFKLGQLFITCYYI